MVQPKKNLKFAKKIQTSESTEISSSDSIAQTLRSRNCWRNREII